MADEKIWQLTQAELEEIVRDICRDKTGHTPTSRNAVLSLVNELLYRRKGDSKEVWCGVESMVSMRDKKPYVRIRIGAGEIQMPTPKAVEHAYHILLAAASADSDAFLMNFIRERLGVTDQGKLNTVLTEFRDYKVKIGHSSGDAEEPDSSPSEDVH